MPNDWIERHTQAYTPITLTHSKLKWNQINCEAFTKIYIFAELMRWAYFCLAVNCKICWYIMQMFPLCIFTCWQCLQKKFNFHNNNKMGKCIWVCIAILADPFCPQLELVRCHCRATLKGPYWIPSIVCCPAAWRTGFMIFAFVISRLTDTPAPLCLARIYTYSIFF